MATLNSLMKHLRARGVHIGGSRDKRRLKNIGYYHGYKGYRFVRDSTHPLPLTSFDQVFLLNTMDMELKTLFYPELMFIETALKNYTLEAVVNASKEPTVEGVWDSCLTAHRECSGKEHAKAWEKRLRLRSEIDGIVYENHKSRDYLRHFWSKDRPIPIWAVFEAMTLGNFGAFFSCLSSAVKWDVVRDLGMPTNVDSPKTLTGIIFSLKDLRNAVAHNGVIFDVRFQRSTVPQSIGRLMHSEMGVRGVTFQSLTDYAVLTSYLLLCLQKPKGDARRFLKSYQAILERYRASLPYPIFSAIVPSDTRKKLGAALRAVAAS